MRGKVQETFPLDLYFCKNCHHVQLLDVVNPDYLFSNYLYVSGTSPAFVKHFENYANFVVDQYVPNLENQLVIGFALETEKEKENAISKLKKKNLDFIVLNSTKDKGATFEVDTNKISIIEKDLSVTNYDLKEKSEVAKDIVSSIIKKINK